MRECSERDCLHLSHPFLSLSLLQLTTDELQTFVDAQFEELKRLVHVQEARNRHLVDLKEAFVTAAAAEQIAEITVETERLQEEMTSALATMRVDYDQVKIKDLDTSSNPLLNKRRKKAAAAAGGKGGGANVCQSQ